MNKILAMALVTLSLLFTPSVMFGDEISDIQKEMEELQGRLEALEAEDDHHNNMFDNLMDVSGYADGEFIWSDKKGDDNEFRVHHLSLFFIKQISDQWRMFSEIEYEDAPKIGEEDSSGNIKHKEGKIFVEVFTIDYYLNRYVNFRLGRFLTPGGIWNVDHYPPFVLTQERPQHIRKIFPQLNDGLQFRGSVNAAQTVTDYILYVSNGQGNTGHGDGNEDKAMGGRLKFAFNFLDNNDWDLGAPEIGFSYYREELNDKEELKAAGVDLVLNWKNLKFQGEYAKGFFDPPSGIGKVGRQRTGYYGQLAYDYKKWTVGYRYDWYVPDDNVEAGRKTVNSAVLNYHFTPYVVGKLEYHWNDPHDGSDNYNKALLSVAVYLGD